MLCESLLVLAATFSTTWVVLFTLEPTFVKVVEADDIYPRPRAPPDPAKCMILAVVVGLLLTLLYLLFSRALDGDTPEFRTIRRELAGA